MYLVLYCGQAVLQATSAAGTPSSGAFALNGTSEEPERIINLLSFHFTLSVCWKVFHIPHTETDVRIQSTVQWEYTRPAVADMVCQKFLHKQ